MKAWREEEAGKWFEDELGQGWVRDKSKQNVLARDAQSWRGAGPSDRVLKAGRSEEGGKGLLSPASLTRG